MQLHSSTNDRIVKRNRQCNNYNLRFQYNSNVMEHKTSKNMLTNFSIVTSTEA